MEPALYNPITNPEIMVASDHVLPYFTAFRNPLSPLYQNAFGPTFPNDFVSDIASGSLPSVSWIIPPLGFDEHPSSAPANGMYFTSLVLDALTANPSCGRRRRCSSCTTRTTAGSTTCRRRRRRRARPAST